MSAAAAPPPRVVCLGGSLRPGSRSVALGHWCRDTLTGLGAEVTCFLGEDLDLPLHRPGPDPRPEPVRRLVETVGASDGVVLLCPTYHGSVAGPMKNALDHLNDLQTSTPPFLDGRPAGCVTVADGPVGAATALSALRTAVHALRAWPTPMGVTAWGDAPDGPDDRVAGQLTVMLSQVMWMARFNARRRQRAAGSADGRARAPG